MISLEFHAALISGTEEQCDQEEEDETDADAGLNRIPGQVKCLGVSNAVCERQEKLTKETERLIIECQRLLRLEKQMSLRQTSIWTILKKLDTAFRYSPSEYSQSE